VELQKLKQEVLVYLLQQKLRKENPPFSRQIDRFQKNKGLENQDIILGLNLLMKNQ